jgi:hypothetical protein
VKLLKIFELEYILLPDENQKHSDGIRNGSGIKPPASS